MLLLILIITILLARLIGSQTNKILCKITIFYTTQTPTEKGIANRLSWDIPKHTKANY